MLSKQENRTLKSLADCVYQMNYSFSCCDLFYEVELPDLFELDHPTGSVMGRAKYADGFSFGQNCTVGNNRGVYPVFEKNVTLCVGASVLGSSTIGEGAIIGSHCCVKDEDVPPHTIAFGQSPNLIFKPRSK